MRRNIILIFTIVIGIAIIIIFIWWQKNIWHKVGNQNNNNTEQVVPQVDLAQLKADYENNLRALLPDYMDLLQHPVAETVAQMRQRLLDLKLPAEFRDLHAQLVLLLDKLENLNEKDTAYYQKSLEEIIKSYDWLK